MNKILLFLASVTLAFSQIAFDNTSNIGNTNYTAGGSVTFSYTVTGTNPILFVGILGDTTDIFTGVTYNTVGMTLVGKQAPGNGNTNWTYLYVLVGPATGAHNIVASSPGQIAVEAVSYSHAAQTGQPDAFATNNALTPDSSPFTTNITTHTPGAWTVGILTGVVGNGGSSTKRSTYAFGSGILVDSNGVINPAGATSLFATNSGGGPYGASSVIASFAPDAVPAVSVIRTSPILPWSNFTALQAGHRITLDGTLSQGLGTTYVWQCLNYYDGSNNRNCDWLKWSSHTTATVNIDGLVHGNYTFQLCVFSGATKDCTTQDIGSVSYGSNGVIFNSDPNVDLLHGSAIAYGQNPWGFMDERQFAGVGFQYTKLTTPYPYDAAHSDFDPPWAHTLPGTVDYTVNGSGSSFGVAGTTLNTGINTTDLSIIVNDASKLDLTEFPTRIFISANNGGLAHEEIRISAATGNTGVQTLTVPYDGRGISATAAGFANVLGPTSWSANAVIGQNKVVGHSTSFLATFCPAGAGAPIGPRTYNTGTVGYTAGTSIITGSGTTWTTGNDVLPGYAVAVTAAHSAVAFKVVAYIVSVDSTTQLTVSRVLPTIDTATGLTYSIIKPWYRYINGHFTRPSPYAGDASLILIGDSCESDTSVFYNTQAYSRDITLLNGLPVTGAAWSWYDETNSYLNQSQLGGLNTYDYGSAFYMMWKRSGNKVAKSIADAINNNWIKYPVFQGMGLTGQPFTTGGGVVGASASYVLTGTPVLNDLRPFWANDISSAPCDNIDIRDSAYGSIPVAYAALFDTDLVTFRPQFRTQLQNLNTRDNNCRRTGGGVHTNSWATGIYWNTSAPNIGTNVVTLTQGTNVGSGVSLTAAMCDGIAFVTVTMTANSSAVTATSGTFSALTNVLSLDGRAYMFLRASATTGNISVLWPNVNGSYSALTRNADVNTGITLNGVFANSPSDVSLENNYACLWNSSSSITLDKNFVDASGMYYYYGYNLGGRTTQPFMLGIRAYFHNLAAPLDALLGTNNAVLRDYNGLWQKTYGIDSSTNGMNYARGPSYCESGGVPDGSFLFTIPGCEWGLNVVPNGAVQAARQLNIEAWHSIKAWYLANPTAGNKDFLASFCAAVWGSDLYDSSAIHVYTDANSVGNTVTTSNLADNYQKGNRWVGIFFGMGKAHECPALLAGGVQAAINRSLNVGFSKGTADHVVISLMKPDGGIVTSSCTTSPCAITANAAEGDHLIRVQRYTVGNAQLSDSGYFRLTVQ